MFYDRYIDHQVQNDFAKKGGFGDGLDVSKHPMVPATIDETEGDGFGRGIRALHSRRRQFPFSAKAIDLSNRKFRL